MVGAPQEAPLTPGGGRILAPIANRYVILSAVGRGGMSEVLKVEDLLQDRRVLALKRFRIDAAPEAIELFRREFLTRAQLRHPNVAQVFDFGAIPDTGELYFTSEYVDAIDLVQATDGLSWEAIYELTVELCRGLAYVHSRGLVHRDVKPSNVLVERAATGEKTRSVKLIDFGLATALPPGGGAAAPAAAEESSIRGTVDYLAPEVVKGQPIDRRADLYALGVTLFEVATRRRPFRGASSREVLEKHLVEPPPRPRDLRKDVPEGFEAIILRLLEKEPARRTPSADQVIRELSALLGQPIPIETRETGESYVCSGAFVGRDAELRALIESFGACFGGGGRPRAAPDAKPAGHFLLVCGEPGSGKARLLLEWKHRVQVSNVDVIEATCDSGDRAYAPIAEIARKLLQLSGDAAEGLLGSSRPIIRRFLGEDRMREGEPPSGLSSRLATRAATSTAARDRLRLFDAIVTFLIAATFRRPAVVILHDLERARAETLALTAHLARALGHAEASAPQGVRPALLLAATLREEGPGGEAEPRAVTSELAALEEESLLRRIRLAPLPEHAVARLAASMLGIADERRADLTRLAEFLFRETGGNPYFIEELMKSLLETHAIRRGPSGFEIVLPRSSGAVAALAEAQPRRPAAREIFRERLSRLGASERRVLGALAVARRPVSLALIEAALDPAEPSLGGLLDDLAARGILARESPADGAGPVELRFAHELFRAAVYAELDPAERRALHAAFGAALEARAGPEELPALVEHFGEAGLKAKTFRYATRAADEARALFANERAIALYERALDVVEGLSPEALGALLGAPGDRQRGAAALIDALESLGRVRERLGDHAAATEGYRRILALGPSAAEVLGPGGLARIHRRIGETLEMRGEHDQAIESFAEGLKVLGEGGRVKSPEGAKLLGATASTYVKLGLYDMAIAFCKSGLSWLAGREDGAESVGLLNTIGVAFSCLGRYDDAAAQFELALVARERLGELEASAQTLNNLGAVHVETGQIGRAIAFFEQALERSERTGDARSIAETAANLGNAYSTLGQDERAKEHFGRGLAINERLGDAEGSLAALNHLGSLETDLGLYDVACPRLERAERLSRRLGETRGAVVTALFGTKLHGRLGDYRSARTSVERALSLARKLDLRREQADGAFLLARIDRAEGRLDEAERGLNRALTDYEKLGNELESAAVTVCALEVLIQRGDLEIGELLGAKLVAMTHDARAGRLLGRLELALGHLETALGARERAAGRGGDARLGEAVRRLERARDHAREGRRPELLWQAERSRGCALEIAGADDRALACYVRAMEIVRELYDRVPHPSKGVYLSAPSRTALRQDFRRLRHKLSGCSE